MGQVREQGRSKSGRGTKSIFISFRNLDEIRSDREPRTHSSITPVAEVHSSVACCKISISHPFEKSLISQDSERVSSSPTIRSR